MTDNIEKIKKEIRDGEGGWELTDVGDEENGQKRYIRSIVRTNYQYADIDEEGELVFFAEEDDDGNEVDTYGAPEGD